jgi:hypothetical protein
LGYKGTRTATARRLICVAALIDMKERMNPELQQTSDTLTASVKRPAEQHESTHPVRVLLMDPRNETLTVVNKHGVKKSQDVSHLSQLGLYHTSIAVAHSDSKRGQPGPMGRDPDIWYLGQTTREATRSPNPNSMIFFFP